MNHDPKFVLAVGIVLAFTLFAIIVASTLALS